MDLMPVVTMINSKKNYPKRRVTDVNTFKSMYRFTEENVKYIASYFLPEYNERRGKALSNEEKMKSFLRYVGDPGFQVGVGEDIGIHQTTVCKTNWYVCQQIVLLASEWIKFPSTLEEMQQQQEIWRQNFKFPDAIGAIDCTHVTIKKPAKHGDEYINRKGLASFNVQATCNGNEYFTSVNCEWPGSVHDARIWRTSKISNILNENPAGALLLGDEGYALTPWLMTPYRQPTAPNEIAYNTIHKRERCVIERMFGQLKQRFPILQNKMRIVTEKIPHYIVACFVLHNVAKFLKDEDFETNPNTEDIYQSIDDDTKTNSLLLSGIQTKPLNLPSSFPLMILFANNSSNHTFNLYLYNPENKRRNYKNFK